MKKNILALLLVLLGFSPLKAEDGLVVSEATVSQSGTGQISVDLINDGYQFVAFTFRLTLPEGISFVLDSKDPPCPTFTKTSRFTDHGLSSSYNESTNSGIFACLSTSNDVIQGTDGKLLDIYITSDDEIEVGDEFDATLSEITFTTKDEKEVRFSDVAFKITVDDGHIKFNETSTTLPVFTEGDKGDVKMTRTIKTGVWNTIVLPFTLTKAKAEAIFGSDVELATFSGFETEYDENDEEDVTPDAIVINFSEFKMTTKKPMKGGTPYLIRIHKDKDIESFEAKDVTLTKTVTPTTGSDEWETDGKFTGSLVKTVVPEDGLFISNEEFWYSTGKTNIKAFRGWFELDAVLDKETDFGAKVRINIEGEPTYIEGIKANQVVDGVYNLQGVFIGDKVELNRLPKGIYIVNGQKVMVK